MKRILIPGESHSDNFSRCRRGGEAQVSLFLRKAPPSMLSIVYLNRLFYMQQCLNTTTYVCTSDYGSNI